MWERHLAAISVRQGHIFRGKMPLPRSRIPQFRVKPEGCVLNKKPGAATLPCPVLIFVILHILADGSDRRPFQQI